MISQKGFEPAAADAEDIPALRSLWKTVFGDADADIARFFSVYFSPELTVVVRDGGTPVSAAYILPVGSLARPEGARESCAMLYAIATLPDYRGRGFGGAVTRAAAALALDQGFSAVVLKPADPGLFGYYEKRVGFVPFFEADQAEFRPDALPAKKRGFTLTPAAPARYRSQRQRILGGSVYIDADERALSYQQQLCAASGGALYVIGSDNGDIGCAAVEKDGDTVRVNELLLSCGYEPEDAAAAIAGRHAASRYVVRYPGNLCRQGVNKSPPFAMILPKTNISDVGDMHCAKWYGPAFD
jgi:GNAT superfamily N-acetyltransferase